MDNIPQWVKDEETENKRKLLEWDAKMTEAHGAEPRTVFALNEECMKNSGMTLLEIRNWGYFTCLYHDHRIGAANE